MFARFKVRSVNIIIIDIVVCFPTRQPFVKRRVFITLHRPENVALLVYTDSNDAFS